jgi:hypothetical protein
MFACPVSQQSSPAKYSTGGGVLSVLSTLNHPEKQLAISVLTAFNRHFAYLFFEKKFFFSVRFGFIVKTIRADL